MAAAPGGKTSQLANTLLGKEKVWMIVANDVNGQRLWTLAHNLNQWGRYNTFLTKFNGGSFGSNLPNFFDHVLLDAPCSGEWTGFKSDYAMKFWNQAEINKICGTQLQLLVSAIKTVKPWWTVVYSTCTLNPFENEGTLAKAFQFFGDSIELLDLTFQNLNEGINRSTDNWSFEHKEKVSRCWPHLQKTWWFFIAKIRKLSDPKNRTIRKDHKLLPRNQFKVDQSKWLQKKLAKRLDESFWIKIDETKHFFVATKEKAYLCSPTFKDISPQLNAEKMWIPIAKLDRLLWFRPTHHLWNMLGHTATKHVVQVTAEQIQQYSQWNNIPLNELTLPKTNPDNRYLILQWEWFGMSIGKIVDNELKNKFGK
jgi:16S rRNA (cytosine1407-C5)-methyltransferase